MTARYQAMAADLPAEVVDRAERAMVSAQVSREDPAAVFFLAYAAVLEVQYGLPKELAETIGRAGRAVLDGMAERAAQVRQAGEAGEAVEKAAAARIAATGAETAGTVIAAITDRAGEAVAQAVRTRTALDRRAELVGIGRVAAVCLAVCATILGGVGYAAWWAGAQSMKGTVAEAAAWALQFDTADKRAAARWSLTLPGGALRSLLAANGPGLLIDMENCPGGRSEKDANGLTRTACTIRYWKP